MYRLDFLEQLKLRLIAPPRAGRVRDVGSVVWHLGFTSLLTDVSAEMVNSALPGYLVLYLHLSPLEYGAIDGVYNGLAVALLSLAAGFVADRSGRPKRIALAGYGLSMLCKPLLLMAGAAWGWILAVVWIDRTGKSIRTAPRDAILSLNASPSLMATAFALHRGLDAFGSLLGPLLTFLVLFHLPTGYKLVWIVSFGFALHGLAVLMFRIPADAPRRAGEGRRASWRDLWRGCGDRRLVALAAAALLLSTMTISDGFVYLLLQKQGGPGAVYFPLFYVGTAGAYVLLSLPAGRVADRVGRLPVLVGGYAALGLLYLLLLRAPTVGLGTVAAALALLGLYYAATEGVLTAMTSVVLPAFNRATGIALVGTAAGIGKLLSSLAFGWMWERQGTAASVGAFGAGLAVALLASVLLVTASRTGTSA